MGWLSRLTERFAAQAPASDEQILARLMPMWQSARPLPQPHDYRAFAQDGYRRNAIIFACITELSTSAAEPPLDALRVRGEEVVPLPATDPLSLLMAAPNPEQSRYELLSLVTTHLHVAGNAYLHKVRARNGKPVQLWPLRPDRIEIKPGRNGLVESYAYSVGGQPTFIPAADVVHFTMHPDPLDDYYGLSPIAVLARFGDLDNSATDFLRAFFLNAGVPGGLLTFKSGRVEKPERERIRQSWRDQFSTSKGWHDVGVMDADVSYQELGSVPRKLDLSTVWGVTESRICCVPGTLIFTQRGMIPIENVRVGDQTLTHRGRWRAVLETMKNPVHDQVHHISAKGLDPLQVTGNHPVLAAEYLQTRSHLQTYNGSRWMAARDLRRKKNRGAFDALTLPIMQHNRQSAKLRLSEWIQGRRFSVKEVNGHLVHSHPLTSPLPKHITYSPALGRLLGFYLAEGAQGSGKLLFYFNAKEKELHEMVVADLKAVFGVDSTIKPGATDSVRVVVCQNAMLTELFECGTARTKKLPTWAWNGDRAFFEALLWAWIAGDGTINNRSTRGATSSFDLAWNMRLVAISCGHEASIITAKQPQKHAINGRSIVANGPSYIVSWRDKTDARRGTYRIDGDHLTSPIQTSTTTDYSGPVYNLEVEEDHSYLTNGGMVHNCMVFGVPAVLVGAWIGLQNSTFANYETAQKSLWQETLSPFYVRLADKLTMGVASEFGADRVIRFDLSKVQAFQENRAAKEDRAQKNWDNGMLTMNEARLEQGYPEVPDGNVRKLPTLVTLVPAGTAGTSQQRRILPTYETHALPKFVDNAPDDPFYLAVHKIADRLTPELRDAFLRGVLAMDGGIDQATLIAAVESGDMERAFAAIPFEAFADSLKTGGGDVLLQAIAEAGASAALTLQDTHGLTITFDLTNPRAQQFAATQTATMVTEVTEGTKEAIRAIIERGFSEGLTPQQMAMEIRQVVGLTSRQMQAVTNFRGSLMADGIEGDALVNRVDKYAQAQLRYRATMIARQETLSASNAGQRETWLQALDKGLLSADQEREWILTPDGRLCQNCERMDGARVKLNEPWQTPAGPVMIPQQIHPTCRCAQGLVAST